MRWLLAPYSTMVVVLSEPEGGPRPHLHYAHALLTHPPTLSTTPPRNSYGNAESNNKDDGAGTMECVYFGTWNATRSGWCGGAGLGPFFLADLENGLWGCNETNAVNPLVLPMNSEYAVGMVKGGDTQWGLKAGDAGRGPLVKTWEGPRPPGYQPMNKQGSVLLGIGGDNSDSAVGVWFEGVLTSGYTTDAVDEQLMADIVGAYGK